MKRTSPRLLTAAITPRVTRFAVRATTGVRPLGAQERPTWSWLERPVSSPQWITAPAAPARLAVRRPGDRDQPGVGRPHRSRGRAALAPTEAMQAPHQAPGAAQAGPE